MVGTAQGQKIWHHVETSASQKDNQQEKDDQKREKSSTGPLVKSFRITDPQIYGRHSRWKL